jgi:TusA-related sulfurtransferase
MWIISVEAYMSAKLELNLLEIMAPVCLLKCKSALEAMKPGNALEVLLQDPEVVEDLIKIIDRSGDKLVKVGMEGNHYRIRIEKTLKD